jgi:diguanylate cyclase (GGDEF)-like protein
MYQATDNSNAPPKTGTNAPRAHKRGSQNTQEQVITPHRFLSIKVIAYASAVIIITLFLAITATNLILAKSYYRPVDNVETSKHLKYTAQIIEEQLAFFQNILQNIAIQPTTQDLLEFSDELNAERWAIQVRRFLPQAIGVALLSNTGKILGEPASQRLGPMCITDLAKLSQGEAVPTPPVHREIADLAHFDLTAPVYDDIGNQLGLLFISFSLDTVRKTLKHSLSSGQELTLFDGEQKIIAHVGQLQEGDNTLEATHLINNSQWQLKLEETPESSLPSFLSLVIFNISALLLTIGVTGFLVRYARASVDTDFQQIKEHLDRVSQGSQAHDPINPKLRETTQILPLLENIQRDMFQQKEKIATFDVTDDLTGLPNRRQFEAEFQRAYDFARRDLSVCIVMMSLDFPENISEEHKRRIVKLLAKTLGEFSRKIDMAARLEEDQFALVLFGMGIKGAMPCLERLRESFYSRQGHHPSLPKESASELRCGYTMINTHRDNDADEVLNRAYQALAQAEAGEGAGIVAA